MTERDVTIGDWTFIFLNPANFLPVFFLVLEEDELIVQILTHFDSDLFSVVRHAPHCETLHSISDIPYSIFLSISVFGFDSCILVIIIAGKYIDASFVKLCKHGFRCEIIFAEIFELFVFAVHLEFHDIWPYLKRKSNIWRILYIIGKVRAFS